ncbi:hypothetical protein Tco_0570796 [Tanacetum coccineum]
MVQYHKKKMGKGSEMPTDPHHTPTIIQPLTSQPKKKQRSRRQKRKDTEVPQPSGPTDDVADEAVYGGVDDIIDLEKTKTSQAQEIISLKRRVKRLEKNNRSKTHGLKRLYKVGLSRRVESSDEEGLGEEDASKQGRIADIDADAGINLVSTHFDADTDMFGVHDLVGDEVVVESEVAVKAASTIPVSATTTTTTVITDDEITLAKELAELRSKGKMVEPEPVKKLSKKDQLMLDEELAFKLQAELEEEDRLVRQREEEANIVSWDNVQAMIDDDYQMA